jgi:hypothetical protein
MLCVHPASSLTMCTIESLGAEIVALCAHIHRAEYRLLELIEKLDADRSWRHEAMPSARAAD